MAKLIECVPNFSEGRRPEVVQALCDAITSVEGVTLLDQEMDADHNRCVITFVSHPSTLVEAAFRGYQKAAELIDMQTHRGEHPRMGACDVCPLIPLSEVSLEEAVELAQRLAQRVASELRIPVYMYEDAATSTKRKNLANVRAGEYEGIRDTIGTDPERKPDFGPSEINLKSGATAIGVRFPLVAFNVYLGTRDNAIAGKIADAVRHLTGGYRFVKALGFEIKERNQVQISMNLTNYTKTPIFRVFETIKCEAERHGVMVTSSEVVGLLPMDAIVDVADHYLRLERFSKNQILEEKLRLVGHTGESIRETFYDEVASASPAPGGGSVAASAGALCAALTAMVCRLTVGKKQYAAVSEELAGIRDRADTLRHTLTKLIETDKNAFNSVMQAFKLPKTGDELAQARSAAIIKTTIHAARVPLEVMTATLESLKLCLVVAQKGNENSISDAGVAALLGRAAIEGAHYNVRINIKSLAQLNPSSQEKADIQKISDQATQIQAEAIRVASETTSIVTGKL